MTAFWPTSDHWSVKIPLDTPHPRLPQLAERGFVVLADADFEVPASEYEALEYMDWKSGGDTNFAPIASADGELDCRGFWDKGKTDKDALWTSNADVAPSVRRYVDVDRRQLRPGAGDQARAAVARRGDPLDPPRRQQPLQPRRRGLGRALVAGADRQPRQLHAADGQRPRRPARPRRPRSACRCTAVPASSSTPSACGTSSCTPATAPRYALITSFESGPVLGDWIDAERAPVSV